MGTYLKRIVLFAATNVAVLLMLVLVLRLLGVERLLAREGVGLDLRALLVWAAVVGFAGALLSLAASRWMAKRATGARVLTRPRTEEELWLVDTVRRLAERTGIGMPEVAIYPSPVPNAFATGARRDHALVAVSTGILAQMRPQELEAVLGHEVSHVANGDMVTLTLLQGVVNTFVLFVSRVIGSVVDRAVFRSERDEPGPGYWVTSLVAQLVLGLLATLIVMAFSRSRELRADRGSAGLLGPRPMIAALRRLEAPVRQPAELPTSLRAFGIRGDGPGGLGRMFLSHPPLPERIARLEALEGQA